MRYIYMVFAILFCLSFTAPSMANDETQNNEQAPNTLNKLFEDMFRLPAMVDCGPPQKILAMMKQYGEKEVAQGKSFIIRPDMMLQPGPISLFANPNSGTWTMVIKYKPEGFTDVWCIMGAGTEFGPAGPKTSI